MKLTKQQITYIENQLIQNGVKYWDIRIELLDHVVTDVEHQLKKQEDFEKAVHNSFISLGWKKWDNLKIVVKKRSVLVNKKYKKMFYNEIINFFKSIKNNILFSLFLFFYGYLFFKLNIKVFYKVSFSILALSFLLILFIWFFKYKRKVYKKSLYINFGSHYLIFSFLMFNITNPLFVNKDSLFNFSVFAKEGFLAFFISVHLIFLYAGYKTYLKAKNEVDKMYKELQKL